MRYNERNSEHIGDKNVISVLEDDDSVFEVSAMVLTDIFGKIQANYDLTVYGNIDVTSIVVMGNLICFGNCHANNISVQGKCTVFGNLSFDDGMFSDDLEALDIEGSVINSKGKIICSSLNYEECFTCERIVIATDGIMGVGSLNCDLVISGEYASVEDAKSVFVISDIGKNQHPDSINREANDITEPQVELQDISALDWYECLEYIKELSSNYPEHREDFIIYNQLMEWGEKSKLSDLVQVVSLADLVWHSSEFVRQSDLYSVVKKDLLEKSYEYIQELVFPTLNQEEFSGLLSSITNGKDYLPSSVYDYLVEALFNKLGLKYNTVKLMLGE